jgi:hypothetical protein
LRNEDELWFGVIQTAFNHLRRHQTQLTLFNGSFALGLWLYKVFLLLLSIFGGYSAIKLAHTNPPLALVYSVNTLDAVVVYIAVFQLAYRVQEEGEEFQRVITESAGQLRKRINQKYVCGFLRSVRPMAVRLG